MASKTNAGNGIGKVIPEGWHTRNDVAQMLDRSLDTIRRWEREGIANPSGAMELGKLTVHLYSDEDIDHLREATKSIKMGRPPHAA